MSDFKYDSYDQTSMKVAFQSLRQTQQRAFLYGTIFGLPLGYLLTRKVQAISKFPLPLGYNIFVSLVSGSIIYGLYSWGARANYNEMASKVNRKYSKIITKVINY